MRPDHPLGAKKTISLTECASYPVLMLDGPWFLDQISETEFAESGAAYKTQITTNSLSLTKISLLEGLGIGFFTPTGFIQELTNGTLTYVPLEEREAAKRDIGLFVHRARKHLSPVKFLAEEILASFAAAREAIFHAVDPERSSPMPRARISTDQQPWPE